MSRFCVIAGTKITLNGGKSLPIENIKAGEEILSFDLNTLQRSQKYDILVNLKTKNFSGVIKKDTVKNIWKNTANEYFAINDRLKITGDHIVLAKRDNIYYWTKVVNLKIGDYLFTEFNIFEKIETIILIKEKVKVFNLEVNSIYNYFANSYLIHNGEPCSACNACGAQSITYYINATTYDSTDNPLTTLPRFYGGNGSGGADITKTMNSDVTGSLTIPLSDTSDLIRGMTVIGGRTGSATGNNISVLISDITTNTNITVSDSVYLNEGDTLYFSSGLLLMGRHDDTSSYFGAGTTYPKLVPESFYTGGTANLENPGTNIRDPPKITKVEVPDGMNICFFELWGADSSAHGGRKYKSQSNDRYTGFVKDGEQYGAYDEDHQDDIGRSGMDFQYGYNPRMDGTSRVDYVLNDADVTVRADVITNSQLETHGRGAYMKGYFITIPGNRLYIGLGETNITKMTNIDNSNFSGSGVNELGGVTTFNGGGAPVHRDNFNASGYSGGGCSHIAFSEMIVSDNTPPNSELYRYRNFQEKIVAVAGGGGGADSHYCVAGGGNGGAVERAYGTYVYNDEKVGQQNNSISRTASYNPSYSNPILEKRQAFSTFAPTSSPPSGSHGGYMWNNSFYQPDGAPLQQLGYTCGGTFGNDAIDALYTGGGHVNRTGGQGGGPFPAYTYHNEASNAGTWPLSVSQRNGGLVGTIFRPEWSVNESFMANDTLRNNQGNGILGYGGNRDEKGPSGSTNGVDLHTNGIDTTTGGDPFDRSLTNYEGYSRGEKVDNRNGTSSAHNGGAGGGGFFGGGSGTDGGGGGGGGSSYIKLNSNNISYLDYSQTTAVVAVTVINSTSVVTGINTAIVAGMEVTGEGISGLVTVASVAHGVPNSFGSTATLSSAQTIASNTYLTFFKNFSALTNSGGSFSDYFGTNDYPGYYNVRLQKSSVRKGRKKSSIPYFDHSTNSEYGSINSTSGTDLTNRFDQTRGHGGCVLMFKQISLPSISIPSSSPAYQTTSHVSGSHSNTNVITLNSEDIFIVKGMGVTGTGISGTVTVSSISGTTLTLSSPQSLSSGTQLTFTNTSNRPLYPASEGIILGLKVITENTVFKKKFYLWGQARETYIVDDDDYSVVHSGNKVGEYSNILPFFGDSNESNLTKKDYLLEKYAGVDSESWGYNNIEKARVQITPEARSVGTSSGDNFQWSGESQVGGTLSNILVANSFMSGSTYAAGDYHFDSGDVIAIINGRSDIREYYTGNGTSSQDPYFLRDNLPVTPLKENYIIKPNFNNTQGGVYANMHDAKTNSNRINTNVKIDTLPVGLFVGDIVSISNYHTYTSSEMGTRHDGSTSSNKHSHDTGTGGNDPDYLYYYSTVTKYYDADIKTQQVSYYNGSSHSNASIVTYDKSANPQTNITVDENYNKIYFQVVDLTPV